MLKITTFEETEQRATNQKEDMYPGCNNGMISGSTIEGFYSTTNVNNFFNLRTVPTKVWFMTMRKK